MVLRNEYLEKLRSWKDEQVIKVVTGIRRCGKSTLLKQYQELLKQEGIQEAQVISINFEELEFEEIEQITGLTANHIRVLLSRGRSKVKEMMRNER